MFRVSTLRASAAVRAGGRAARFSAAAGSGSSASASSHELSRKELLLLGGVVGLAGLVGYKPELLRRSHTSEADSKRSGKGPSYENLNIETAPGGDILISWHEDGFKCTVTLGKGSAISDVHKTPLPPAPAPAPAAASSLASHAPAPAPVAKAETTAAPPAASASIGALEEGLTRTPTGWVLMWKKNGEWWMQEIPDKGPSGPATKYQPTTTTATTTTTTTTTTTAAAASDVSSSSAFSSAATTGAAPAAARGSAAAPATSKSTEDVLRGVQASLQGIERALGLAAHVPVDPSGAPRFTNARSLLAKHLHPSLYAALAPRATAAGFTLDRLVQAGVDHPDGEIGVFAGDAETYTVFAPLLDPILADLHGAFSSGQPQPSAGAEAGAGSKALDASFVVGASVSAARNIDGLALSPAISRAQRRHAEQLLAQALQALPGSGKYVSLAKASAQEQELLQQRGVSVGRAGKQAEAAGINRDWPDSRGVYVGEGAVVAHVNGIEQLQLSASAPSLAEAHAAVRVALAGVQAQLAARGAAFLQSDRLGYVTACPSHLGTGLTVSLQLRLPHVAQRADLAQLGRNLGVQASASGDTVVVTSTSGLGVTEAQQLNHVADAAAALIAVEKVKA